jgi:uncharacterized protein with NRDE domain
MCLVITALAAHPRYAVVVAANRDEFHARAARVSRWSDAAPFADILAGRDLKAGGTWMGVRRDGRWALVTNVREGRSRQDPAAPSRGDLVPAILNDDAPPASALPALMQHARGYNGFNLLAGDADGVTWASNRAPGAMQLDPGVHGLSNALLDVRWPKVARTMDAIGAWAARGDDDFAPVFAALADRGQADDHALPSTGVPLEWERLLSAPFIVSADYGTRCSTLLAIGHDSRGHWIERTFDAGGNASGDVEFEFAIPRGNA